MNNEEFQKTIIESLSDFRNDMNVGFERVNGNIKRIDDELGDIRREIRGLQGQFGGIFHLIQAQEEHRHLAATRMDRFDD